MRLNDAIEGLDSVRDPDAKVFQAGTRVDEHGRAVSSGGRVLTACALGKDITEARERAYAAVRSVRFEGMFFRRDIGHRALNR